MRPTQAAIVLVVSGIATFGCKSASSPNSEAAFLESIDELPGLGFVAELDRSCEETWTAVRARLLDLDSGGIVLDDASSQAWLHVDGTMVAVSLHSCDRGARLEVYAGQQREVSKRVLEDLLQAVYKGDAVPLVP